MGKVYIIMYEDGRGVPVVADSVKEAARIAGRMKGMEVRRIRRTPPLYEREDGVLFVVKTWEEMEEMEEMEE